jgi:CBS-domain-containing membrane protein
MLRVAEVMIIDVIAIDARMPFREITDVLRQYHVWAAPVVDSRRRVLGMVSVWDLLNVAHPGPAAGRRPVTRLHGHGTPTTTALSAAELMNSPPVTISAEAALTEAASVMRIHRVGRLPVVEDHDAPLLGIVSHTDLAGKIRRPDPYIRRDITDRLLAVDFGLDPRRFRIDVADGAVIVEGKVERRAQIPPVLRALRRVEGVVSTEARLEWEVDDLTAFTAERPPPSAALPHRERRPAESTRPSR